MMHQKTVLVVAPYFPPHPGGLERYAYESAVRLRDAHGWHVEVLTSGSEDRVTVQGGLTIHELRRAYTISNTPWSFRWWRQVGEVLAKVRPDVVVVHTPVPGLGDVVALRASVPVVVTYHAGSMRKGRPLVDLAVWLYEATLLRLLLRRAAHVICASAYVRDFLALRSAAQSVITPGVATDRFVPDAAVRENDPTILCVAALGKAERYKGVGVLIDTFRDLLARVPTARLRIVGSGDCSVEYQDRCTAYGIADRVTFTGALHGDALVREYQRAHVFALPTMKESFGMALAEAMSAGLPVVSLRTGGVPSLVLDGVTGDLVEPGDVAGFARALTDLLTDATRQTAYGKRGREHVSQHFTWDARAAAYDAVLTRVCAPAPTIAVVSGYYPPHVGGMEQVAEVLARTCASRGYPVRVFTSRIGADHAPTYEEQGRLTVQRLAGFEVAHTPILPSLPLHLARLPRGSIVHVHVAQAFVPEVAYLAALVRGLRFITHLHLDVARSGAFGWLLPLYKRFVLGPVLRHADLVIVLTEAQAQFVRERYAVAAARIAVLPNGVSLPETVLRERARGEPLQILCVGRMTVQKRFDRAIDAVARITIPAVLTIVGDGEDRSALEAQARERGVAVVFAGARSPREVAAYYRQAHVFLMPSDHEGMPLVVLEAMAFGLPVVGGAVPGVREILAGVGVLVPPTPEAFAAALTALDDDTHRAAVAASCRAAAGSFSWERVADTLEGYYDRVHV